MCLNFCFSSRSLLRLASFSPEILQKITLYLEAGLTVRAAVNKIAEDYEQTRKNGHRQAYTEVKIEKINA